MAIKGGALSFRPHPHRAYRRAGGMAAAACSFYASLWPTGSAASEVAAACCRSHAGASEEGHEKAQKGPLASSAIAIAPIGAWELRDGTGRNLGVFRGEKSVSGRDVRG